MAVDHYVQYKKYRKPTRCDTFLAKMETGCHEPRCSA